MIQNEFKDTEIGKIPVDWEVSTMENCLEEIIDYRGKTPEKSDNGILTLSAKSVKNGYIDYSLAYHISKETYDKFMVRGFPKKGDILMTTEAPMGCIARLDRDDVAIAQRLLTLRGKKGYLDNEYLKYYLMSETGQFQLRSRESGTTVTGIKQSEFRKVLISIPPVQEQEKIAQILSALDDKIENNNEQNKILEETANSIFKEWFVEFNFLDEDGLPYFKNGRKMEFNEELGIEIPKGWKVSSLDRTAMYLNGLALQKYPVEEGNEYLPVIKIRELKNGITESTDKASLDVPKEYIIENGDVLFSWSGSLEVVLWYYGKGALNQHLFKVFSLEYPKWFYYLWTLRHLKEFKRIAEDKATTMGHIQRKHLKDAKVLVPDNRTMLRMTKIFEPFISSIINNGIQSQILIKKRDALLPKLMGGEIRLI